MMGTRSLRRLYTWPARRRSVRQVMKTLGDAAVGPRIVRHDLVRRSWRVVVEVRDEAIADGREDVASVQEFRAGILVLVPFAGGAVALLRGASEDGVARWWWMAAVLAAVAAGVYLLGWAVRGRGLSSASRYAPVRRRLDVRVSTRSAEKVIRAAVIRAVNDVLGEHDWGGSLRAFPRRGSRIVEMDPRELVETRSHREVTQFVEENDSCTVGLHGARGMGKTALMLRLQRRHFGRGASVRITSPSLRQPAELPRIVLMALAKQLEPAKEPLPAKWPLVLGSLGMVVFLASGLALAFLSANPGAPFTRWMRAALVRDPDIWMIALVLGFVALIYALGAFLVLGIRSAVTSSGRSRSVASSIVERYTSEVEASSTTGVGVTALLGLSVSGARTTRALPAGHADVVHDFERLVRAYRGSSKKKTVLVLIDELDRLPLETIEALLNEIKDFFHMDGVRVVVSVSDEVLTSFYGRRTSPTDVVDSSFDTVMEMRAMSPQESVAMMNDRVVAVPPRVTYLCHAISGGRPRELLRTCRLFVQETWGSAASSASGGTDPLGVGFVEQSRIAAAASATIGAIAMDECRRLQKLSAPGTIERRLSDAWRAEIARGEIPQPGRRARAAHPNSARLFVALSLIRRHLAPWVTRPAPTTGPDPVLPMVEALAHLVAALQAEEHVWRSALTEVSRVGGSAGGSDTSAT